LIHVIGLSQTPTPTPNELAEYIKANYNKREVSIPVRDGVKLFTSIYEPKDTSKKYPILLNRTPYTVGPYGEQISRRRLARIHCFAKEGYIFVYQDCARPLDERR
jgi:predicted acyl esterase